MPSQPLGHDAGPSAGALGTARTHCPFSTSPSCCLCPSTLLTLPTIVMRGFVSCSANRVQCHELLRSWVSKLTPAFGCAGRMDDAAKPLGHRGFNVRRGRPHVHGTLQRWARLDNVWKNERSQDWR